jgi:hypothetical protein
MATNQPTKEQLDSRAELSKFLERVAKPVQAFARNIKSEWFGRPDQELKDWIDRGRAIAEIQDSTGYRLIMAQVSKEIAWAQTQLEVCPEKEIIELRCYLKSLRFLRDFILTTERNADISSKVLAGRANDMEKHSFVKGATNDRSGNN